jgi:drug/metabolite transporter (DMT)-like permease
MPVFVSIFARIFLKEACGIFHVVTIGVTLIGIAFTSKLDVILGLNKSVDTDSTKELYGLLYSMGATLVGSSVYIFVRKVKECHNSVIMFNFSLVAILETSILTGISGGFKIPSDTSLAPWFLMILAVLSFYAQLLLTKALQLEEASLVSVTRASSEVVCAFLFQIFLFGHLPDVYAVIGSILVTSSVILTAARKWVSTLPKDHPARHYLEFTLK